MVDEIEEVSDDELSPEQLLEKAELEQSEADDSNESPPSDIVAFNELRSCADLFRLQQSGKLNIQPDYQREIVWPPSSQTRFIDSLAKQLPIPSMCISLDYKTDKREVVDGLQRMSSIIRFLEDQEWRLSKLDDIDPKISNKKVSYVREKHREIYERVENTTIPITVIRCDLSKRNHQEYLFTIFHRLNTGGSKLSNQEIRNCIYNGSFNELLKEIVATPEYRTLFDINDKKKYRYSNEELVLRVLAYAEEHEKYKSPLTKYLNGFMAKQKNLKEGVSDKLKSLFIRAINVVYSKIFNSEPLPKLSKAVIEAMFVGVILNLDTLEGLPQEAVRRKYDALREDDLFSVQSLSEGLSATEKVRARLARSITIFS